MNLIKKYIFYKCEYMANLFKDKDAKLQGLNKYSMPASYKIESWRKPAFFYVKEVNLNPISDKDKQMILDEIAEKLPEIRRIIGISQTELGNKVGLSRQSISAIERGCVPLSWSVFLAIMLVVVTNEPDAFNILDNQEIIQKVIESLKSNP
jgi:putative transcriptional regulator